MPKKKFSLAQYKERRKFKRTPEPKGKKARKKPDEPIFVIQEHHASRIHWDLRLEIKGVLVSWAIPKGPSLNPAIRRIAIMTEDHPIEYAGFEGVIPKGMYGAGPVMVWDTGTFENKNIRNKKPVPLHQGLEDGYLEFFLHGTKLQGSFVLIKPNFEDGQKEWLLIKRKDKYASKKRKPVNTQKKSALTGRTMARIRREG
ncbi:MAG: DNA polymerase ligase N-terminal domain-containing protein [Candidatus Babeliales bacterium]